MTGTASDIKGKRVGVINTKAGNLFSLFACLKRIGLKPLMIDQPEDVDSEVDALVVPGQGRFGQVMEQLNASGLGHVIKDWIKADKPLVGICVGLQVLFESSAEDPGVVGLSIFKGKVGRLESPKQPMVGWAKLDSSNDILDQKVVYFVNSYGVKSSEVTSATVTYGEEFVSAINKGNLWAFQFHPEKSGAVGEEVMKQCLN
ncbi:imidazole glycerol phosphate synthase subunit HisH [Kangiella sediminilitoris]|uniref:Imidazole glycerol phosphate synthase, glutamine amidotransferase subunit n=1 Tax=Kangiella sediminilitoris TaxID=1144748 RepID=A0A1B3BBR0_9GAMM|nr:imidazole glycerol phosphate synthase subunit HisH [Kangiella sediminilitoris]AOE50231.1 Imidazole glycerol phosphate synthase, glutamine amidotransferase subunit [Kangiella sediminilitoris]